MVYDKVNLKTINSFDFATLCKEIDFAQELDIGLVEMIESTFE